MEQVSNCEVCGDNRFEIIEKAKMDLLESTNINTDKEEMKVLDNFLFRCWQMGWLKKYEKPQADKWIPCEERLPDTYDNLLICQSDGYVNVGYYSLNEFKDMNSYPYKDVIAWQPLPQPYKKEGAE